MASDKSLVEISEAAINGIRDLPPVDKKALVEFLKRLSENPYDPNLIKESAARGDVFASPLDGGYYVYWTLDLGIVERGGMLLNTAPRIRLLALEKPKTRAIADE